MIETLKVQGMSCGHCVNAVKTGVGELGGVSVDLKKGEVAVDYDSGKTSLNEIQEAIEEQGYNVV